MMNTPFFPSWRSRLAAVGRRTAQTWRQATLSQLQEQLRDLLPASLLSRQEDGLNSRQRDFPLRLTFECFLWQMLKPRTACREVVRQVQALRALRGLAPISAGDSVRFLRFCRQVRRSGKKKAKTYATNSQTL